MTNCKLDNGDCGFLHCVGNPGTCGINMEGAGKCNKTKTTKCWFNTDCPSGETCQELPGKEGHQHINQTCSDLLSQFKSKVKCDDGYVAAVSSDPNYNGSVNKQKTQRQPCAFVCNKSSAPGPSPSKGMSTGLKIGIAVGAVILLALVVLALVK